MDVHGAKMTEKKIRRRRSRLVWTSSVGVVVVLILGIGAAYYIRSNLPVEMTRADVVGTWVEDAGPGIAVFREDGTAVIRNIPGGDPATGQGKWSLSAFQGPTISVQVGSRGFDFGSKWDNFRTVLITYSGDPDDPNSKHVFIHKTSHAE